MCQNPYSEQHLILISQAKKLFYTLSHYPYLALLVYRLGKPLRRCLPQSPNPCSLLEIRDFPKAVTNLDDNLLSYVLKGLKNCTNLRSCIWTRDGSLTSDILEALHQCKNLRELELNGHNIGNYDPQLLLKFTELHRISLIMPSVPVVCQLKPWLSAAGASLRSLTLICKVCRTQWLLPCDLTRYPRHQASSPTEFLKQ